MLVSIHAAAGSLIAPELAIDKEEGDQLGKALLALEAEYPTKIDPKVLVWANLLGVCGMVYGPRIFAMRIRAATEKAQRARQASAPTGLQMTSFEDVPFSTSKN